MCLTTPSPADHGLRVPSSTISTAASPGCVRTTASRHCKRDGVARAADDPARRPCAALSLPARAPPAGVIRQFSLGLPKPTVLHKKTTIRSANGVAHRGTCHGAPHRRRRGPCGAGKPRPWPRVPRCTEIIPASKTILRPDQFFIRTNARFSVRRHQVLPSHDGGPAGPCHPSRTADPMRL